MKNILLTLDYELFGDGSGDVFKHIIEPTDKILDICNTYNIKITIFFEVVEYLKLKIEWNKNNPMGYNNNPIQAIDSQLQRAAVQGHDIQLHIHPQWIDAKYINHKWEVDFSNWRLGGFCESENYSIERLLAEGKRTIEELIRPVLPDYKCIALRAGGYNVMPSQEVYIAMKNTGLKIDSSVYPGGYETSGLSNYDYRHISHKLDYWWACPKDITRQSVNHKEILEIPIFALIYPRWRKFLNYHRIKSMLLESKSVASSLSKSKLAQKSAVNKIKYFLDSEAFTWDYFLFDSGLHRSFLNYIDNKLKGHRSYFVLIGHPKSPLNENAFIYLIDGIKKRNWNFKTISQFYREITSIDRIDIPLYLQTSQQ